jgi:D-alanyl-D-alanine carboxypeptidase
VRRVAAIALAAFLTACTASTDGGPEGARGATETRAPQVSPSPSPTPGSPAPEATPTPTSEPGTEPSEARTRFAGRIAAIPSSLEREMTGTTWHEGCPVPLEDLRVLRFNYWGFDGEVDRGPLVVNAAVAEDVLWMFRQLYDAGFPMKRVGLARAFHERRWEEQPDSRRSVTASFNCRVVITPAGPGSTFSQHSYGLAIDVNPLQNPFVRSDGWVRNRFAAAYVDRSRDLPGMIHEGDVVVRSFAAIGWTWGGHWSGDRDYMHFSPSGT